MARKDDMMMRRTLLLFAASLVAAGAALLLVGCGELKTDLPAPAPQKGVHDVGWNDPSSTAFHGAVLKQTQYNTGDCVSCHAKALTGGISGQSCFSCHESYPHKAGWNDSVSTQFHGKFLLLGMGTLAECASCHGAGYDGGTSGTSCYSCHASYPHKTGWTGNVPATSHGGYLSQKNWQLEECASCHGSAYTGGTGSPSCFTCHAAYPHTVFASAGGHPAFLFDRGYPLDGCKTCHGTTYDGSTLVHVSCMSAGCHVDAGGQKKSPEACNTCHGDFRALATNTISAAPPKGVMGDSATTSRSVGAHQKHLASGALGKELKCVECHTVPTQVLIAGHVDTQLPAEVDFHDTMANLATAAGTYRPAPAYNATTLTCANTYCHGNWKATRSSAPTELAFAYADSVMTGANHTPSWTGGPASGACTSCHSLPPAGHIPAVASSCGSSFCHVGVVAFVDNDVRIIDKTKHINGKINVRGTERDF
jgi:predicted CxxxxCH...CXXCH cytochrome family protein